MRKIVKLTENDLSRIVKRVLNEQSLPNEQSTPEIRILINSPLPAGVSKEQLSTYFADENFKKMILQYVNQKEKEKGKASTPGRRKF
jgi:hypothetical protein